MKFFKQTIIMSLLLVITFTNFAFGNTGELISKDEYRKIELKEFKIDETKMEFLPINLNHISSMYPTVYDACPGRWDHEMLSSGWGKLIRVNNDGSRETVFNGGAAWQCKWCYEVLVTEYDPLAVGKVGYYCMRYMGNEIPLYGLIMEASPENIKYTNDSKVPYCKLFYR